ncbi:MAG: terpene synthase family protein [Chloroflexota bacterium]
MTRAKVPATRAARHIRPQNAVSSPWAKLHSRFMASLDPAEQSHIYALSVETAAALQAWAGGYPVVRAARILPLSLSVAASAPFSSVEALISTARLSLWVFTLDDLFDEQCAPEHTLRQQAQIFRGLAYQHVTCPPGDHLGPALRDVRDDLASYPLFQSLGDEWAAAVCGTIDAMLREYDWRATHRDAAGHWTSLPSYDEYLAVGRYSIGGPPHIWAAMITADDPSTPDHLDHLRSMEQVASTCIRLANDLQSYHKELLEGNVNALVIVSRDLVQQGVAHEAALEQAEEHVRADIAAGLERLWLLRKAAVTRTGHPEAAIDNIARFVCDFYAHHDYHTFLSQAV